MLDDIVPDSREVLHQLCLAGLCIEVGHTGIEVVGTHGMSHGLILLAELMTVLIVVFAVLHAVADGDKSLGQGEIFLIARLAIHLRSTHIVAGTDGIARELSRVVGQEVIEEVGSLPAAIEQGGLAGGTLMDDTGCDEVTEVIGLEIKS